MRGLKNKYTFFVAILVYTLFFNNLAYASGLNEVLSLINNYYYDNSDAFISSMNSIKTNDKETFINTIENKLDKYSNYYTAEEVNSEISRPTENLIKYSMISHNVFKIKIYFFGDGVDSEFLEITNKYLRNGTETLILDLSDCTGGRIDVMANIAKEIVPNGLICTLNFRNSKIEYVSELDAKLFNIIVITSSKTASAAEALTAALAESNSAIVIGENTYGKSAIQQYFSLSGGGVLKLTVGFYTTRKGNNIESVGIKPHIKMLSINK